MAVGRRVDVVLAPSFALAQEAVEVYRNGTATRVDPTCGIGCDFVGNVEVEAIPDENDGGIMFERILFTPQGTSSEPPLVVKRQASIKEEEECVLESFVSKFFDHSMCGDLEDFKCEPKKSILKKHSEGKHVNRNVSFSNVEFRNYKMTLGDNPSARSGPPMSLDWEYTPDTEIVTLDAYERARQPRRARKKMRISLLDREDILVKQKGFSYSEVKDAWAAALEVRKQRLDTIHRTPTQEMVDEALESASRKFWRLFGCETI